MKINSIMNIAVIKFNVIIFLGIFLYFGIALAAGDHLAFMYLGPASGIVLPRCNDYAVCGDGICQHYLGENTSNCVDCQVVPVITGAEISFGPYQPIVLSHGDYWCSTWGLDGDIFMSWGDGCGPGVGPVPSRVTDAGIAKLSGSLPDLECNPPPDGCIRSIFTPSGDPSDPINDKPGSLLSIDGRLYFAGHSIVGDPVEGYIAYSDDDGVTFTKIPGSPWVIDSIDRAFSPFRCLTFINMGRNYELNTDGYVYGFGIGRGYGWDAIHDGSVYLTRAPVHSILDYSSYTYYAGTISGSPVWSADQRSAAPVPGLLTEQMASSMFHEGTGRFLFMNIEGLFESENPYGPWVMVAPLFYWGDKTEWQGGYMPTLITKDAGPDFVYFAYAGQDCIIDYSLHIGRIDLTIRATPSSLKIMEKHADSYTLTPFQSSNVIQKHALHPAPALATRKTIRIPHDYATIQEGINAANSGDTILLADGIYEGPGNINLEINGPVSIRLKSESGRDACVIDCRFSGRGFIIRDSLHMESTIQGISVVNGYTTAAGGGMLISNSSPIIRDCKIQCCSAYFHGGGIMCYESTVVFDNCMISQNGSGGFGGGICAFDYCDLKLQNCRIEKNYTEGLGGGIYSDWTDLELLISVFEGNSAKFGGGLGFFQTLTTNIQNCWFLNNHAAAKGGGIFYDIPHDVITDPSILLIENCTLFGNTSGNFGGGFHSDRANNTNVNIVNTIFWNNAAVYGHEIALLGDFPSALDISYCDVQGGSTECFVDAGWTLLWGAGMISADPLFAAGPFGDFYLSNAGSGQPVNSPCINVGGDTASSVCMQLFKNPFPFCLDKLSSRTDSVLDDGIVDMGAHYPPEYSLFVTDLRVIGYLVTVFFLSLLLVQRSSLSLLP